MTDKYKKKISGSNQSNLVVLHYHSRKSGRHMNMLFLHKNQMVHVGRQRTAQTDGPAEKLFATSIWVTAWVCSLIVRQSNVYYISSHGDVLRSHVKYQTSDCKDLVVQQCPGMLQHLSWLKQEGILFIQPKQAQPFVAPLCGLISEAKCSQLID